MISIIQATVNFLNTTLKQSSTGKISTTLFKKETDCQAYFHIKSEHPEYLKRSIPYIQAVRLKRICTEDRDFKANCDNWSKKRLERGYKKAEIYCSISKRLNIMNLNVNQLCASMQKNI